MSSAGQRPIRVFFFGDSVCFGQGVSLYKGWVTRISAELDALSGTLGQDVLVVNASVNGNTTRQALERMPYDVQSHGVDVLIVQFGMNDCNHWQTDRGHPRVSRPAFRANLDEIVDRAVTFGARRILLNTNHPTARDVEPMPASAITYQESNRLYNATIREVAASHSGIVRLNDVERAFLEAVESGDSLDSLLLSDGIHPSERGHELYFQVVSPAVRSALVEASAALGMPATGRG